MPTISWRYERITGIWRSGRYCYHWRRASRWGAVVLVEAHERTGIPIRTGMPTQVKRERNGEQHGQAVTRAQSVATRGNATTENGVEQKSCVENREQRERNRGGIGEQGYGSAGEPATAGEAGVNRASVSRGSTSPLNVIKHPRCRRRVRSRRRGRSGSTRRGRKTRTATPIPAEMRGDERDRSANAAVIERDLAVHHENVDRRVDAVGDDGGERRPATPNRGIKSTLRTALAAEVTPFAIARSDARPR